MGPKSIILPDTVINPHAIVRPMTVVRGFMVFFFSISFFYYSFPSSPSSPPLPSSPSYSYDYFFPFIFPFPHFQSLTPSPLPQVEGVVEGSPPSPVPDHGHDNQGIERGPITIFFLMIFQVRGENTKVRKQRMFYQSLTPSPPPPLITPPQ